MLFTEYWLSLKISVALWMKYDRKMSQRWPAVPTARPCLTSNPKVPLYVDCSALTGLKQTWLFQPKHAEDGTFTLWARDFLLLLKWHHWTLLTASALEYLIWLAVMHRRTILADVIRFCVYRKCLCNSSPGTPGNDVNLNARHSCWNCAATTLY